MSEIPNFVEKQGQIEKISRDENRYTIYGTSNLLKVHFSTFICKFIYQSKSLINKLQIYLQCCDKDSNELYLETLSGHFKKMKSNVESERGP